MTDQSAQNVGFGVAELIRESRRLGLTWELRPGTVSTTNGSVLLDGDSESLTVSSLIGALLIDMRVMVMLVPQGGNYVIGVLSTPIGQNQNGFSDNIVGPATVTSASYIDLPGLSFLFTKAYAGTRVLLSLDADAYSTVANTVVRYGGSINSADYNITELVINNEINEHQRTSGHTYVPAGIPAGTYTVQGRWARTAGTGVITLGNSWHSMSAREVL